MVFPTSMIASAVAISTFVMISANIMATGRFSAFIIMLMLCLGNAIVEIGSFSFKLRVLNLSIFAAVAHSVLPLSFLERANSSTR